jgi:1,3-beta-glucan synthase
MNAPRMAPSEMSTPTFNDYGPSGAREPYPAWSAERQIPLSKEYVFNDDIRTCRSV